ncbi:MAG: putative ATPase, partial [Myxococcota bacterium]
MGPQAGIQQHPRGRHGHESAAKEDRAGSSGPRDAAHAALGLAGVGSPDAARRDELVAERLASRPPTLLVLDNVEPLDAALAPTLRTWLERAPNLRILCTSQIGSGLGRAARVAPLPPADAETLLAERLRRVGATETAEDHTGLLELLDGLPLAIEQAASQARALPLGVLVRRVKDGRGVARAVSRSVALLPPTLVEAIGALAVMAGELDVEAVEALLGDAGLDQAAAMAERSLVQ